MTKTRLMALLVLSITLICGCMGGGGGGGTTVVEKDVAGITATLNRFAEALRTSDPTASGVFAQTTGDSETTKVLYVKDFGADLSNPEDNQTWEFRVNTADITQPAPDTAIVKASKVMSTGNTLWLIFSMLKEEGEWRIQGITIQETGLSSLVTASYYPIVPGNRMVYYSKAADVNSSSYLYTVEFSNTDTYQKDGITYHRVVSSGYQPPVAPIGGANRLAAQIAGGGYQAFTPQGEVWAYDPYINGGVPYRLMKSSYAFGETDVIVESYGEGEVYTTTITIGSQMKPLVTPLKTYMVLPVTQQESYTYNGTVGTHTEVLYFAEGVGLVGIDRYQHSTTVTATDLLYERLVNGVVESNNPVVSAPSTSTSQEVIVGQNMVPVQFSSTGGTPPITWKLLGAPAGVTLTQAGYLSGTPDPNAPLMTYPLTIRVQDVYERWSSLDYSLSVVAAPQLTVTPTGASQNVTVGHVINSVQFTAANATGDLNWSITGNPVGISLSNDGLLYGELSSSVPPGDYPMFITASDSLGGIGSVEYLLVVQAGSFQMNLYSPLHAGDEYTYVPVEDGVASAGRYIQGLGLTPLVINGLEFYPEWDSYANSPVVPVVNIRRALVPGMRSSAKASSLRAQLAPEDEPYYRAVDGDGNIWFYQKYTNGGAPFKMLRTWYNPGDVDTYVSNYDDGVDQYVATTTMTVENSLVDFFTPYQQFTNVLKITFITEIDFGDGFALTSKSEQFYVKDLGMVGYYSYSPISQTEFESSPDYMELLLSAKVGGLTYENLPSINSSSVLDDAIIGSLYPITLNSGGGVFPHRFVLLSGELPLGLTLNENGQFIGTVQDQAPGTKTFSVRLIDVYYQVFDQEFSITVR